MAMAVVRLAMVVAAASAFVAPSSGAPRSVRMQSSAMSETTRERISTMIEANKVMLFMKGTKMMPMCGFSNMAIQILNAVGSEYETCDVLSDEAIRAGIKEFSDWPTIPQLYVGGEFVGGSDIMLEMYQEGELQPMIEVAVNS